MTCITMTGETSVWRSGRWWPRRAFAMGEEEYDHHGIHHAP